MYLSNELPNLRMEMGVLGDAHVATKQELEQLSSCRDEVAVEVA